MYIVHFEIALDEKGFIGKLFAISQIETKFKSGFKSFQRKSALAEQTREKDLQIVSD